jgi:hypothetical protein
MDMRKASSLLRRIGSVYVCPLLFGFFIKLGADARI